MGTEGTYTKEEMAEKEGELGAKEGTQNGENGKEKWSEKEEWHDPERRGAEEVLSFDEVLVRHVGQCGRYQIGVCLLLSLVAISNAFYIMDVVFITAAPASYRCDVSKNGTLMSSKVGQMLTLTSTEVGQKLAMTSTEASQILDVMSSEEEHTPAVTSSKEGHTPAVTSSEEGHTPAMMSSEEGHTPAMMSSEEGHTPVVTSSEEGHTPAVTSSEDGRTLGPVRQCVVRNGNLTGSGDQEGNGTLWGHGVTCTKWTYEDGPFKDTIVKQVSHLFTQSRGSGWG